MTFLSSSSYAASTLTISRSASCSPLIEDFEVSYVRTIIEDGPLQLSSRKPERNISSCNKVANNPIEQDLSEASEASEMEEEDEPSASESGNQLRMKITLASPHMHQGSAVSGKGRPTSSEETYWDEHDPTKKWHFEGKVYSRVLSGKEHFYCQLCEDDGKVHHSLKRREIERHLRRLDHLPPELFCKSAKAVCPCPKNRAFTRIDGRKRHIKISIEHARREAQCRRASDEVEKWQQHMKLLETSRGH